MFLEIQGIETSACFAQGRHLVHVLTIEMAVEAVRVHYSHDPFVDWGATNAQLIT